MFKENFDALAGNNDEEYLRHFGFTVEDLSFLISPQSSLSPIKKKQRNVFNFDGFDGEIDKSAPNSAREPPIPGTYAANYPTVYEHTDAYMKEEPLEQPAPSFDKLELGDLAYMDDPDAPRPLTNSSMNAQAGSGASSIATEYVHDDFQTSFARNGSSMGLGSLAFSTMSSFNFEETDTDELANFRRAEGLVPEQERASGSLQSIMNMNLGSNGIAGGNPFVGYNKHMVPPLPSMGTLPPTPPSLMCLEDASFIISAQQQQLFQQQQLLEQQQRALSAAANGWQHQSSEASLSYSNSESSSQPVSRHASFKSNLPPLSVDMNALNAAHHAHHQAKLLQQTQNNLFNNNSSNSMGGNGNGGVNTNSSSAYSILYPNSTTSSASNRSRSSTASSPERFSYTSDGHVKRESGTYSAQGGSAGNGGRAYLTPRDDRSLSNAGTPNATAKDKDKGGGKDQEKEDSRASKSLATISRRFVEHFGEANTFDYISGQLHVNDIHDGPAVTNRVDGAAEVLGVHVRRIYELIKILEILSLVTFTGDKRGKFSWRGTKDFLFTLGAIQADGIQKYPDISYANGLRLVATPAAAVTSALTSTNSTPIHTTAAFSFGHFPFGSNSQDPGDVGGRSAAVTAEGIADCDLESLDAPNSLAGGPYLHGMHLTEDMDVNIDAIDFSPDGTNGTGGNGDFSPTRSGDQDLDGAELDAFVHLIAADSMLDALSSANAAAASAAAATAAAPKYSKKRTAVKKGAKATATTPVEPNAHAHEEFMVEGICKSFLQLFLIGLDSLSMNFAIQKLVPMEPGQTLSEYNKVNATKIRRVYDVANVLCSLSLINKIMSTKGKVSKGGEVNTPDSHHSNSNNTSNHHSRDNSSSTVKEMFKNGRAAAEAAGGNSAGNGKSDSKVLEWGSFPPTVIREYYLSKMH